MKFKITKHDKEALCRQAPEFAEIVRQTELSSFECCGDLFPALVQSIVSQQLAIKAADAIFRRVKALLGEITVERLLAVGFDELRACGLSNFETLTEKSDAEIIAELVKLKGVGVWTAEMLLIFALGRPDVLSFKDLGIRRGIMLLNHLDDLTEADFEIYRKRYSPYGTLASLYLWRIKDSGLRIADLETTATAGF